MRFLPIFLLSCLLLAAGCADDKAPETDAEDIIEEEKISAEEQYNQAQDKLEEKGYDSAATKFLDVERQYPYSKWAIAAQIQAAYAYYKNEKYDKALPILERFIKLNPVNNNVAYAYYLIARSYYNQIATVDRDQKITQQAQKALQDVISRFPDSSYARDAQLKLDLVVDHLAGKEMVVGRYYLQRKQYIGAINRFKKVVEDYPTTGQVEEALYRLTEAYLALGITPEAQKYAAVLGHNYPSSQWYQDAYDLLLQGGVAAVQDGGEEWYKAW